MTHLIVRSRRLTPIALTLLGLAAAAPAAFADWKQPVAGASPINASATHNAGTSQVQDAGVDMTAIGGQPYVAWNEDTTQQGQGSSSTIHVARLAPTGMAWLRVGETLTPSHPISLRSSTSSDAPSLESVGGAPWIAWQEGVTQTDTEIRVAKLNGAGSGWDEVPSPAVDHPINHIRTDPGAVAQFPTLRDAGGRPYVSFFELDPGTGSLFFNGFEPGKIWVDRLNATGDGWDEVGGGPANPDLNFDAAFPRMTVIDGTPWLVFLQVSVVNNNPALKVDVAHLSSDGQSWIQSPSVATLSAQGDLVQPRIVSSGGRPYVLVGQPDNSNTMLLSTYALNEAGDGWNLIGGGPVNPGDSAAAATIANLDGVPWVSWTTKNNIRQIHAARLVGGVWQRAGGSANADATHQTRSAPVIASVNGFPWVGFAEDDGTAPGNPPCCTQVRVSRLEPEFGRTFASPSDTAASLIAEVSTYGLTYPTGFQFGAGTTLDRSTTPAGTNGNPAFAFQTVSGLTPATLYSFRPFATAGTPLPLVVGAVSAFATQPTATSGGTSTTDQSGTATSGTAPPTPAPMQPVPAASTPARLLALLLNDVQTVRRGHRVSFRYLVTDDATVRMIVRRRGRVVATLNAGLVSAGRHTLSWRPRGATGLYRVQLESVAGDRSATDSDAFRVVR